MKLSVITINYNNAEGLRNTVKSVLNQAYKDFEYIIIDGGSTDGSADIIKEYQDRISYWVSEPDKGVYNAMNKAVCHAKGNYCIFINSGDSFYDDYVLEKVFSSELTEDFVCGNWEKNGTISKSPNEMTAFYMFNDSICHQATFIKTELLKSQPYDESLKLVSDWKHMFINIVINNAAYRKVDVTICSYDTTGISSVNWKLLIEEREKVEQTVLPSRVYLDYVHAQKNLELKTNNPKLLAMLSYIKPNSIEEKFVLTSLDILGVIRKIKRTFIK